MLHPKSTATQSNAKPGLDFKTIVEMGHDAFLLYKPNGTIMYASPAVAKSGGYRGKDLIGRLGTDFIYPEDRQLAAKHFQRVLGKPGRSVVFELRLVRKDKQAIWTEQVLTNMLSTPGVSAVVNSFRDINERKLAQERALESERQLTIINTNLTEGIFMGLIGRKLTYANRAFLKLLGYDSLAQLSRVKPIQLYADPKQRDEIIAKLQQKGRVDGHQVLIKRRNGKAFWGVINVTVFFREGEPDSFIGSVKDITNEKRVQQEIADSQKFLSNILQVTKAPIFVKNPRHDFVLGNEAFARFLARPLKEIIGKNDADFLGPRERSVFWRVDNEVLRTGKTISNEEDVTDKFGVTKRVVTTKARYIDSDGNKFIVASINDITEERKAQESVNNLYQKLVAVLGSTDDRVLALDKDFRYLAFNHAHERSIHNLTGRQIKMGDNILEILPPELAPIAKREISQALKGKKFTSENTLPSGLILETSYNPVRFKNKIVGVSLFIREINERKEAERQLQLLNQQLMDQNRELAQNKEELSRTLEQLAARNFELDQLMYKTSHDLRSPLSSILGLVNLTKLDKANVDDYIGKIEGRIRKLDEFVRSMLNYAKVSRKEMVAESIDLEKVAFASINELAFLENYHRIGTHVKATSKTEFKSDPLLISIIFSNVISNAYKYYREQKKSYLRIGIAINRKQARIEFKDNGIGIRKEHLEKIYNMFYRATDRAEGSGLGMYIVKQAVEKLGGTIELNSQLNEGTTIRVTIPNRI